jgi:hypothetical protein
MINGLASSLSEEDPKKKEKEINPFSLFSCIDRGVSLNINLRLCLWIPSTPSCCSKSLQSLVRLACPKEMQYIALIPKFSTKHFFAKHINTIPENS